MAPLVHTPLHLSDAVALTRPDTTRDFQCEEPALTRYLRQFALKGHAAGMGRTWVVRRPQDRPELPPLLGYYTLAASEVAREELPAELLSGLGRYPVPSIRIGRLARDVRTKGLLTSQGLTVGKHLLLDAHERSLRVAADIGALVIRVDAKGAKAEAFYLRFGYRQMRSATEPSAGWPRKLYLPVATLRRAAEGV